MSEIARDRLFQDAFHYAAIGMALVGLDGRWLEVNQSLCELVGYTEPELLKITFQDITHPADLALDLAYVDDLLRGRINQYQMEKRYLRKDGAVIWVLLHVSLVRTAGGAPQIFISQIQDISARKTAELELESSVRENKRLFQELQERNKQIEEMRGQFLRVCAWTKQVYFEDQWISLEQFLSQHLHLRLTHSISEQAFAQYMAGIPAPVPESSTPPPP